ncbi:helix-turn-helix domain-containing protein [Cysteiniphilum litorale]|uniref:helix-turn-helix domain-containing protein n=1 Tax=Cysteiniphilum litorale TaxID=2056700 RepID=UPI003F884EEB
MAKNNKHPTTVQQALQHWQYIQPIAMIPKNETEYKKLSSYLDELLDICADQEDHPAWGIVNLLSNIIEAYDCKHYKIAKADGIDTLKYLMKEHNLKQSDLIELGSQGVVSEILNKKRELNIRQLKSLANRFNVSVDTFI